MHVRWTSRTPAEDLCAPDPPIRAACADERQGSHWPPLMAVGVPASDASVWSSASGLASIADRRSVPIANENRLVVADRLGTRPVLQRNPAGHDPARRLPAGLAGVLDEGRQLLANARAFFLFRSIS